ncbi:MAG: ECF-type sigma factor [Thermoanaerobaculia bacterium]
MNERRRQVTDILTTLDGGTADHGRAAEELMPVVYDELRRLAQGYLRGERSNHTLESTALVHEAYLRLADQERVSWRGRTHFLAVGAQMMRRLLVDHARHRGRVKRGRDWRQVTLDHALTPLLGRALGHDELLALDQALTKLAELDERQARIVELRFFSGLEVAEVAEILGVSKRTVEGHWTHARAWLQRELASEAPGS